MTGRKEDGRGRRDTGVRVIHSRMQLHQKERGLSRSFKGRLLPWKWGREKEEGISNEAPKKGSIIRRTCVGGKFPICWYGHHIHSGVGSHHLQEGERERERAKREREGEIFPHFISFWRTCCHLLHSPLSSRVSEEICRIREKS